MIIIRKILFKAKRVDNGKWVEGGYSEHDGKSFIVVCQRYIPDTRDWYTAEYYENHPQYNSVLIEVDPETICQYTGWNDNDKKKIWENDIVEVIWYSGKIERYLIWWSREMSMMEAISLNDINFNGHDYWGGQPQIEYSTFCLIMQDPWGDIKEVKVVGNIFDNPELLSDNQ